ncbi:hypothetical protein [Streptomyces halstedii]|uniref:hypothetical protein n=1 Tax=Streptomyces halstedii TaxID=1944 RepID=UPI003681AFEB
MPARTETGAGEVGPKALLAVGHPFWVEALGASLDATDLQAGAWLRTITGTYVQITAVERWTATTSAVHNLTVSDLHTYYAVAGSTPVLVHNCPHPSQDLQNTADIAEAYDAEYAAEYTSPSGATYRAHNKEQISAPPGMEDVFRRVRSPWRMRRG